MGMKLLTGFMLLVVIMGPRFFMAFTFLILITWISIACNVVGFSAWYIHLALGMLTIVNLIALADSFFGCSAFYRGG